MASTGTAPRLASRRATARELEVSLSTVQRHIASGHLPVVDGKVNVDEARRILAGNGAGRNGRGSPPKVTKHDDPDDRGGESSYWDAKKATERARGQLLEMELARQRFELLPALEVAARWSSSLRGLHDSLLTVPNRCVGLIRAAATEGEAHAILDNEIRTCMRAIVQGVENADS